LHRLCDLEHRNCRWHAGSRAAELFRRARYDSARFCICRTSRHKIRIRRP
jgi:hypothetical protein